MNLVGIFLQILHFRNLEKNGTEFKIDQIPGELYPDIRYVRVRHSFCLNSVDVRFDINLTKSRLAVLLINSLATRLKNNADFVSNIFLLKQKVELNRVDIAFSTY